MPNCDWGRACDCKECNEGRRRDICDRCNKNKSTHFIDSYSTDRKGISAYLTTSICDECWDKYYKEQYDAQMEKYTKREKEHIKWQEEQTKIQEEREKWLKEVVQYTQFIIFLLSSYPSTLVSIRYAINKYKAAFPTSNANAKNKHIRDIIFKRHSFLMITKQNKRWYCSKERVDASDFNFLFKFYI